MSCDTSKIRVGDEILVKIKVEHISATGRYYTYKTGLGNVLASKTIVDPNDVIEIIEQPIKVGDTVFHDNCTYEGSTLLYIHEESVDEAWQTPRKWAVVAFKGDMPKCFDFSEIKRVR